MIAAAFLLDCIIGDPKNPFHPIRIIGNGISSGVKVYRKAKIKNLAAQFLMGASLTLIIIGLSYAVTKLIIWGFYSWGYWIGFIVETLICYFLIAAKALKDESTKVYHSLNSGDMEGARNNLSLIVGRDTQNLSRADIVKATVETVSENLSDGVIAPLLFIYIGGAPLGMAYKAMNTLDSMIGYQNDDFEYFGKFAARLDDVANFIPSRISAVLLIIGSVFAGADAIGGVKIYIRDRYKHKSPNAAQTESVCAGALGLCLGGNNFYHGAIVHKPVIGDAIYEPMPKHIIAANRLMYAAAITAVVLLTGYSMMSAIFIGHGYV